LEQGSRFDSSEGESNVISQWLMRFAGTFFVAGSGGFTNVAILTHEVTNKFSRAQLPIPPA